MICYVIKSKIDGRYLIFDKENEFDPYMIFGNAQYSARDVCYASFFDDYETAQHYCHSDCQVVKVEIREVEE